MRTCPRIAAVVSVVAVAALAVPAAAAAQTEATSPTSPVNLATPVDFGAAKAAPEATVVRGNARFEVLGDGLIRMEYSPTASFEDAPTVNALNRRFEVPRYRVTQSGGWLTITTSEATLSYQLGSGPFGPDNTSVRLADGDTVSPQWENVCPFDQVCDAGAAALSGGANIQTDHAGYQSIAGFIAGLGQGSGSATWTVLGAPAGQAVVSVRYANYVGALGGPATRTIDLTVNGADVKTLTLPPTSSWDDWNTVTATVPLSAGTNTVGLLCAASDSCTVNVDTLSVAPAGATAPSQPDLHYLGGYTRGFDTATYGPGYSCPAGTPTAAQCTAALPEMHPGILDQAGYRLLDDSQSAVWKNGWVAPRPGGDVQDGYLFVYGHDYQQALADLNRLTGDSPLLPEYTFGVWFSRYYAYSVSDYEKTLFPAFRANHVPLDTLSVDTNWKSPNAWDGWEWNTSLFPAPQQNFLNYGQPPGQHPGSAARRHRGNRRQHARRQHVLHRAVQGVGLEQRPAGRVVLRAAPAVRVTGRVVLVARLVLRRVDRVESGGHPRQLDQPPVRPGDGEQERARVRPVADRELLPEPRRGLPGGSVVRPHVDAGVHGRHLGDVEHDGVPGPAGRRRIEHRRAVRLGRHWQLPRPASRVGEQPR
jgi:hypothetical protein